MKRNHLLLTLSFVLLCSLTVLWTSYAAAEETGASSLGSLESKLKTSVIKNQEAAPAAGVKAASDVKSSSTEVSVKKTGAINGQGVRVRKDASASAAVIHDLLYGAKFEFLEEKNGFIKCKFDDGVTGWVAKQYVTFTDKALTEKPKYSAEALETAYAEFQTAYAAYTKTRSNASYNVFKKAYYKYHSLAKQSEEYKKVQANPALAKVVIDKNTFTLTVYLNDKPVRVFPIAYGSNPDGKSKQVVGDCRTPDGDFKIRYKEYRKYEGVATRAMWLDTKWGDIGMHGTPMPESIGSRASHGCVRMYAQDSIELYKMVKVGTPVSIKPLVKSGS